MTETETLESLYRAHTGNASKSIDKLATSGSNRHYYRLHGTPTLIGVAGESAEENRAFCYLSAHFAQKGLPVPKVEACAGNDLFYLQEDLGDITLFDALSTARATDIYTDKDRQLLHRVMVLLPQIQCEGAQDMDFSRCYPQPAFDERSVFWDLNYFKYCFLKPSEINFREDLLEDDFQRLCQILMEANETDTFMYRDFQSRNIMLRDGSPWFIDFQGGRRGPCQYDVVSFLWQARAHYPDTLKEELLHTYLTELSRFCKVDKAQWLKYMQHFILFRQLQVLGVYGFRGHYEHKDHFLKSIPYAIRALEKTLSHSSDEYPYLCEVLTRMCTQYNPSPRDTSEAHKVQETLTVSVISFSYKKGIPIDESGNGGGFVFDCRAMHNPGRYEQFKNQTGLDAPVIRFLQERGEADAFLKHTWALTDASVRRYMERRFTHLMICFGCTGGQHRSVYAAQQTALHLHATFGIRVELEHREQQIKSILEAQPIPPHTTCQP